MRDEVVELLAWQRTGERFALATVVATSSSAPRPAGAVLGVHPDGRLVGNVSGGCVEPAVVTVAEEVLRTGVPQRVHYGYSDADALAVGLTCGGEVDLLVRVVAPDDPTLAVLAEALSDDEPVVLVTVIADEVGAGHVGMTLAVTADGVHGPSAQGRLGEVLAVEARAALGAGTTRLRHLGPDGERMGEGVTVLVESFAPRPRLVIVGALDFASALASVGRFLGFRVSVCDARERFATRERFPDADEVIVAWPHRYLAGETLDERSAVCVLTHDPKFDVPALVEALAGPAGYVGVMGSRRTHDDRLRRLRDAGVDESALTRLRSPIGLALGGRSPQETAIAIAAEIVLVRNRGAAAPLGELEGPIHPPVDAGAPGGAAALVLAAGAARRFGSDKLAADLDGRTVLEHVLEVARRVPLEPCLVVVGSSGTAAAIVARVDAAAMTAPGALRTVVNVEAGRGMATSLRVGLEELSLDVHHDVREVVVLLGDQPGIDPALVSELVAISRAEDVPVRAHYEDGPGHPVVLPRRSWPTVLELLAAAAGAAQDQGVRAFADDLGIRAVDVAQRSPLDVDEPRDLDELRARPVRAGSDQPAG